MLSIRVGPPDVSGAFSVRAGVGALGSQPSGDAAGADVSKPRAVPVSPPVADASAPPISASVAAALQSAKTTVVTAVVVAVPPSGSGAGARFGHVKPHLVMDHKHASRSCVAAPLAAPASRGNCTRTRPVSAHIHQSYSQAYMDHWLASRHLYAGAFPEGGRWSTGFRGVSIVRLDAVVAGPSLVHVSDGPGPASGSGAAAKCDAAFKAPDAASTAVAAGHPPSHVTGDSDALACAVPHVRDKDSEHADDAECADGEPRDAHAPAVATTCFASASGAPGGSVGKSAPARTGLDSTLLATPTRVVAVDASGDPQGAVAAGVGVARDPNASPTVSLTRVEPGGGGCAGSPAGSADATQRARRVETERLLRHAWIGRVPMFVSADDGLSRSTDAGGARSAGICSALLAELVAARGAVDDALHAGLMDSLVRALRSNAAAPVTAGRDARDGGEWATDAPGRAVPPVTAASTRKRGRSRGGNDDVGGVGDATPSGALDDRQLDESPNAVPSAVPVGAGRLSGLLTRGKKRRGTLEGGPAASDADVACDGGKGPLLSCPAMHNTVSVNAFEVALLFVVGWFTW